jgi:hypothetical protein
MYILTLFQEERMIDFKSSRLGLLIRITGLTYNGIPADFKNDLDTLITTRYWSASIDTYFTAAEVAESKHLHSN